MKAIISHDIDHITVWEHLFKDIIIPKHMVRMHIELVAGKISIREYILRWSEFFTNKWQNIDELITFNKSHHIPSTFFIAVSKGVGLNYSNESSMIWMDQIKQRQEELGIHGIAYQSFNEINAESDLFKHLSQLDEIGMRMHYVRNTENTKSFLNTAGFVYDSTEHSFKNPYKIGNMWEFPIQIMDGWIIENGKKWQSLNLDQAKESTKSLIDKAFDSKLNYLTIDFHDRYFSHTFETWLNWYIWLIDYLKLNNIAFVNFRQAISELEANKELNQ